MGFRAASKDLGDDRSNKYAPNKALDADERVVHHSYIKKMGQVFKTWCKRYLVLYKNYELVYYQTSDVNVKKGQIKLGCQTRILKAKRKEDYFLFVITIERIFYITARSLEHRDKWVDVLRKCITEMDQKERSVTGKAFIKSIDDFFIPDAETWNSAELGTGNFGTVWRAREKTNQSKLCAIKSVSVGSYKGPRDKLKNEVDLLTSFNHRNIVQLYSVHETSNCVYIIQELCTGTFRRNH